MGSGAQQGYHQRQSSGYADNDNESYDSQEDYENGGSSGRFSSEESRYQRQQAVARANGIMTGQPIGGGDAGGGGGGGGGSGGGMEGAGRGYSVASTHDYLGYPKDQAGFDGGGRLWEEEEQGSGEMW